MPSAANFPGIDGVLGDGNDIYTIQATIAEEHKSPVDRSKKVWKQLLLEIRKSHTWHFVVIMNSTQTAGAYVAKFTMDLAEFRLGWGMTVEVWASVLSR